MRSHAERRPRAVRNSTIPRSIHSMAFLCVCITAVIAFGLPLERVSIAMLDISPTASERVEVPLPLPSPEELQPTASNPSTPPGTGAWRVTVVRTGDSLSEVFSRLGLDGDALREVLAGNADGAALQTVHPGQVFKARADGAGTLLELVRENDKIDGFKLWREGGGFQAATFRQPTETHLDFRAGEVEGSFYAAAVKAGLSETLILRFADIFGWDIDFSHDIQPGDTFAVLYEEQTYQGEKVADGAILAVEFVNRGRTYRAIGFRDDDGVLHYFTPTGQGLQKAFNRNLVDFTRISSNFQPSRWHPILGVRRPHMGVDYAAPTGTPVKASGAGIVEFVGRRGGYGKAIVLDHGRGYTTLYGHLSRFREGLRAGGRIEQGEVIGYVGQTGLATGPHLHYEFRIDGVYHDPTTVDLPGTPLAPRELARFRGYVQPLLVQFDAYRRNHLAANTIE
ncbi:MAG: peptidoglycan DD-metalloendopeptidase family protein [Gammaproteobacteria bacterium]